MLEDKTERKALLVSAFGNVLVWYNFALFMPFLPILSKHFFPLEDPTVRNVVTFLAMSMGLFMRPVGSLIFGPIGDRFGREKAISLAVLLMAVPTFLIGLLPSYESIGVLSPILLIVLRSLQGISMGGEFTAAMVHLVEIAPNDKRGFFGCFSDAGSQVGVLLSGWILLALHYFFSEGEIYQNAWRIPFFLALVLVPFAFMHPEKKTDAVKSEKSSSKSAAESTKGNTKAKSSENNSAKAEENIHESVFVQLSRHKTEVFGTIAITAFSAIAFYTLLNFLPYYLVDKGILTLKESALCNIIANVCMIGSILVTGFLSDIFCRKIFLQLGMITVTVITYFIFLGGIVSPMVWFICHGVYGICVGMYYGSRAAFFAESFPKSVRCTGVSVSFSIAQAIFGGGISPVLTYCISSSFLVVLPISFVVVIALFATTKIEDRTGKELL